MTFPVLYQIVLHVFAAIGVFTVATVFGLSAYGYYIQRAMDGKDE